MSLMTNKESEYKAERASIPSRYVLNNYRIAYFALENGCPKMASQFLAMSRKRTIDQRVVDDIKSIYDLFDTPEKAMARIAEILTRGGRIYDEYSEFLKPKEMR